MLPLTNRDLDFLSDLRGLMEKHGVASIEPSLDGMYAIRVAFKDEWDLIMDHGANADEINEALYRERKQE